MNRIDIINKIGDKWHVGNTENGEFYNPNDFFSDEDF